MTLLKKYLKPEIKFYCHYIYTKSVLSLNRRYNKMTHSDHKGIRDCLDFANIKHKYLIKKSSWVIFLYENSVINKWSSLLVLSHSNAFNSPSYCII